MLQVTSLFLCSNLVSFPSRFGAIHGIILVEILMSVLIFTDELVQN